MGDDVVRCAERIISQARASMRHPVIEEAMQSKRSKAVTRREILSVWRWTGAVLSGLVAFAMVAVHGRRGSFNDAVLVMSPLATGEAVGHLVARRHK